MKNEEKNVFFVKIPCKKMMSKYVGVPFAIRVDKDFIIFYAISAI